MRVRVWLTFIVVVILTICVGLIVTNQSKKEKGFKIYLQDEDILILSEKHILWYNKTSHEIKLAKKGVNNIKALQVPLQGSPFIVLINEEKIFNGSFVNPISSIPPPNSEVLIVSLVNEYDIIKIEKGNMLINHDPRENHTLFNHFKKLNKLKE